jgi:hypothetical protein
MESGLRAKVDGSLQQWPMAKDFRSDHLLDLVGKLALHLGLFAQMPLSLGGLLGKNVTLHGVLPQHLATTRHLEPLLGASMCFDLGHNLAPLTAKTPATPGAAYSAFP